MSASKIIPSITYAHIFFAHEPLVFFVLSQARKASGDVLVFLHADTLLPSDAPQVITQTLSDRRTVLGGFHAMLTTPGKTWWGMSFHNSMKTHYLPLLFRPMDYIGGLRVLFGDQTLFCRRKEFEAVGGFDKTVPIMEDGEERKSTPAFYLHIKVFLSKTYKIYQHIKYLVPSTTHAALNH
jgi:hypothetical protein